MNLLSIEQKVIFPTPMINELLLTIRSWITAGATGGYVLGDSRAGKSTAIQAISHQLTTLNGEPIANLSVTIPERDANKIKTIFHVLCEETGIHLKSRPNTDEMSTQLTIFLHELALQYSSRKLVIFVDEMQQMAPNQLFAFVELYNKLEKKNVQPHFFFFGNQEASSELIEIVQQKRYSPIRGRFFLHAYRFYGIRAQPDLKACMACYDSHIPDQASGRSYTEYFLPSEFAAGWRFSRLSRAVWDIYCELNRDSQHPAWSMQYFVASMNLLLSEYLPRHGIENTQQLDEMIMESLKASNYF